MEKNKKLTLKVIGLIICSLFYLTNQLALYIVAKKLNNKNFKKISVWSLIVSVVSLPVIVFTTSDVMFKLAILLLCVSFYVPTILTLVNIRKYKEAHGITGETDVKKAPKKAEEKVLPVQVETVPETAPEEDLGKVSAKSKKTDKFVFISYSSKDNDIALKTKEILENSGITCWMAPWSITAGSDYAAEIPRALNECGAMVLLLSKSSQESRWVPKEINLAIENGKIIIPFQIDNEIISDSFNFYLTNSQRIAAFNRMNDAYNELVQSLYRLFQVK